MRNKEIAEIFYEIADLQEMQNIEWKPIAFRKAARTLEGLAEPIEKIYDEKGIKGLIELPRIGEGIAKKIAQYLEKGIIDEHQELLKKIPEGVREMLSVPGLGPKKTFKLYSKLKINSIEKLEKLARKEKIRQLEGFGEKSEEDILMGIELVKKGTERKLMGIVLPYARSIVEEISRIPGVEKAELAGSLRRRRETVKDMDIVVFSRKAHFVSKALTQLSQVQNVIKVGDKMTSVRFKNGLQSDMRILPLELHGSGMVHFTGSKEHGIALRNRAIKLGMKFSEYGLVKGNKMIACKNEKEVYAALGMQYVPPELRENEGEIEAAEQKKLPKLIEYDSIKGDLHTHTNWTDGSNSSEEMIRAAIKKGYEYYAITDHSKSMYVANGLDEARLKKHLQELDSLQKKFPKIHILKGAEVDILANGKMDYSNSTLKELDIVIGAVHSGFKTSQKEMTKRLLSALSNEHVTFFAHPTGRLINQRNPYDYDLDSILDEAKKQKVGMEINSHPTRLDFDASHIRMCIEKGVKLVINTDAHSIPHLDYMELGMAQARRGWATSNDVLNTLKWKDFDKAIAR